MNCFPCDTALLLQGTEPGDLDLQDALQLLAAKLEAQNNKYGSKPYAAKRSAAKAADHTGSSGDGSSSDDGLQSSDSSKAPAAGTAALRTARAGSRKATGSSVKNRAKQKPGKVALSGKASSSDKAKSTGRAQSVGASGSSDVGSKGKSTKANKTVGKGKTGSVAAARPKSGYRAFWKEQWDKLKSDNHEIKMTDATKQISSMWKNMDSEGKETYKP